MRKQNALTHADVYKLCQWATTNIDQLKGLTFKEIAVLATRCFDKNFTEDNMRNIRDITGLDLGHTHKSHHVKDDRVEILAREIMEIKEALGMDVTVLRKMVK